MFRIISGEDNIEIRGENKACVTFEVHAAVTIGVAIGSICAANDVIGHCAGFGLGLPRPQNITVSGITFIDDDPVAHSSANTEQSHGLYAYCDRCTFHDIDMIQIGDEAFDVHRADQLWIYNASCATIGVPSPSLNRGSCFNFQHTQNALVEKSRCEDPPGGPFTNLFSDCVRVEQFDDEDHSKNIVFDGLTTTNFGGSGFKLTASAGPISDISLINSTIDTPAVAQFAVYSQGSDERSRIRYVGNTFRGPVRIGNTRGLVFSENLVEPYRGPGVEYRVVHESITSNNTIRNTIEQCIMLRSGSDAKVTHNRCENIGTGSVPASGIESDRFFFNEGSIEIISNIVDMADGSGDGIDLANTIPISIRDNTISNAGGQGIRASGNITGNQVSNSGVDGIRLTPGVGESLVAENQIDGAASQCIRSLPTGEIRILENTKSNCAD